MTSQTSFLGRVAIITGSAQGIGLETARTFLKHGAHVALIDIQAEKMTNIEQSLQREFPSVKVHSYAVDISIGEQVRDTVNKIFSEFGRVDILVNNAGILRDATLVKMEETHFDQVLDVHLKGAFLLTQACAKHMVESKYGKIINLSSVASRGNFGQTNYSAAKAGIIGMTKTWALELSRHHINVNAVAPGLIETDMTRSIPQNIRDAMISKIPLKRMGTTQEIADLILFLASDEASYVQGEVIHINGGYLT